MEDQEFRTIAQDALTKLQRALEKASEDHDFDVDSREGAVTIEFEDPPARFVISPNTPVRQVWVSALVKSFKLDWDAARGEFAFSDGRGLKQLIADAIAEQTGDRIEL
jgi:CyaY protein